MVKDTPCQYPKTKPNESLHVILTRADDLEEKQDGVSSDKKHVEARAVGEEALTSLAVVEVEPVFFSEIDLYFGAIKESEGAVWSFREMLLRYHQVFGKDKG